jgi:hypothetical protein
MKKDETNENQAWRAKEEQREKVHAWHVSHTFVGIDEIGGIFRHHLGTDAINVRARDYVLYFC